MGGGVRDCLTTRQVSRALAIKKRIILSFFSKTKLGLRE